MHFSACYVLYFSFYKDLVIVYIVGTDSNNSLFACIGEKNLQVQCENLTISKLHNIQDYKLKECAQYATEIIRNYRLSAGCYTLKSLADELTLICNLCSFEVLPKPDNNYEGQLLMKNNEEIPDLDSLSYKIPNRLAYVLGQKSYSEIFREGLDNSTELVLVKDGVNKDLTLNVSLIRHMHFLQLSSNFLLDSRKHISYIYLNQEEIIKIYQDKLSLSPKNLNNNITSFNSIGIKNKTAITLLSKNYIFFRQLSYSY